MAIWPFFELLLNALVGIVDTMIAGRINETALAAIAVAAYVGWLLSMLNGALGVGSAAVVARAIGGHRHRSANVALGQAILLAAAWGTLAGAALYALAGPIAEFSGARGEARELAATYIRIMAMSGPLGAVLLTGNAALRAAGDTATPFFVMTIVNVVNVLLSVMLVTAPAPWGGYGVAGIAAGTVGAWAVGAIVIYLWLRRGLCPIRLHPRTMRPRPRTIRRIVRVGVPSLIESSGMWVGNFIVLRIVGELGSTAWLAAHIVAIRVESISFLPAFAIGTAASVLAGQYLGLGDAARARRAVRLCWATAGAAMAALGVLFMAAPGLLARAMTDEPSVYGVAADLVFICGPVQFFFGTYLVLSQALRGAGDTTVAMGVTYLSTFAVRLPAAWLLGSYLGYGIEGVWIALCGELVVRGGAFAGRYLHGGWTRVKL